MENILRAIKKLIPKKIFHSLQPIYHYKMALLGAVFYGFPSKKIKVIGVTGTKGKSSTVEMINAILEAAGYKTAVAGTIRFKIGERSERNLYKMTMPGRFVIQQFLHDAVKAKCDYAILEITSEGARQYRHKFIALDTLVVTNISPEHIESHGSYEKYLEAKLSIARELCLSSKKSKIIVLNSDNNEHQKFGAASGNARQIFYSLKDAEDYKTDSKESIFNFKGQEIRLPLPGVFNIYNALAAAILARALDVNPSAIKNGLEKLQEIKGRVQKVEEGQNFDVVVDYAHTIDSLEKFYSAFGDKTKVCILGNTGGGRDKWKRAGMAEVAERNCQHIILTNEDPYDENPKEIVEQMFNAISDKSKAEIVLDRREAIRKGLTLCARGSALLISGKGTDPYIMIEDGKKIPWSDEAVAREELRKMLGK